VLTDILSKFKSIPAGTDIHIEKVFTLAMLNFHEMLYD